MKPKTPRSKKYLAWLRDHPCMITGDQTDIVAHHVRMRNGAGMGQKPSDYRCIPLRSDVHVELHNVGERSFYDGNLDGPIEQYVAGYLFDYCVDMGLQREMMLVLERVIVDAECNK